MDGPQTLRDLAETGGIAHASTVSLGTRALLITGASGSGKSALALRLLALGCGLVSDDRTVLTAAADDGPPLAAAPPALSGLIEARGLGLLKVPPAPPARVAAVVDLDRTETARLPERRELRLCCTMLPLFHRAETPYFPEALILFLRGGLLDP